MPAKTLIINRYQLGKEIGRGGGGTIYQAHDTLLDRQVAVKVLSGNGLGSQGRMRLLREAQAAAKLNHPNIVSIFDAGEYQKVPFIVMELVVGASLYVYKPVDLVEIVAIYKQICTGLIHAHHNGIVHRDLKPENVLITSDKVAKLTDFGLSRPVASRLTSEGEIAGTVYYMAPEQALGQEVDVQSDLYSLGVMLYESVTGQLPFTAENPIAVISQHVYAPVIPPRFHNSQLPVALDSLIIQLMDKSPSGRPSSATEVRNRLDRIFDLEHVSAPVEEPTLLERIARGRIVGREAEMKDAQALWERTIAGDGQLLLISGEPGIGKSRFTQEVITLAEVSGGTTILGECYPEGGAPYAPFTQIIRKIFARGPLPNVDLPPFLLPEIISISPDLEQFYPGYHSNPLLDPRAEQQRLFDSVLTFTVELCKHAPYLLVIEDIHWADQASLALLRHLVRRSNNLHLMIIATYREVELDESLPLQEILVSLTRDRQAHRIKLLRLDREATGKMIDTLLGEETPLDFVDSIFQETEGNPFYIEEVCKSLVENGKLIHEGGHWVYPDQKDLQIPQSIRVAIQSRISKLPASYQDILRFSAILGREFDFEILASASEEEEDRIIDALELAERAQLIAETSSEKGGSFRFVHALIPLTLVEGLSGLRRRRLHRKVAEVIERLRPDDVGALAYQFSQAEEPGKALAYLKLAGDRAQRNFANKDAIRFYTQALEFSEPIGVSRFDLLSARAQVYELIALRDEQLADISEMRAQAEALNNDPLRYEALIALTDYYTRTDFIRARDTSKSALALAQKIGDHKSEARALYRIAEVAWRDGNLHQSIQNLDIAIRKFELAGLPERKIRCLLLLSLNYINLGENEKGQDAAEEALQISQQINNRRQEGICLRRLGIAIQAQSKVVEALDLYHAALVIHQEIGDRAEECNALNAISMALVDLDRIEEAKEYFARGYAIAEAIGSDFTVGMLLVNYVYRCFLIPGDYQSGLEFLEIQLQKAHQSNDHSLNYVVTRQMTEILGDLGLYDRAIDTALEALSIAERRGEIRNQIDLRSWLGRLYALAGKPEKAHEYIRSSLNMIEKVEGPELFTDPYFNAAYVAWLEGTPQSCQEGLEAVRRSIETLRKINALIPLGFSLDLEARLLLSINQAEAALARSTESLKVVDPSPPANGIGHFYYTRARALHKTGDEQESMAYIKMAYDQVMKLAENLTDVNLKMSWLENVRYNKEIINEWNRISLPG